MMYLYNGAVQQEIFSDDSVINLSLSKSKIKLRYRQVKGL
jgi:hypothetical protein